MLTPPSAVHILTPPPRSPTQPEVIPPPPHAPDSPRHTSTSFPPLLYLHDTPTIHPLPHHFPSHSIPTTDDGTSNFDPICDNGTRKVCR